MLLSRWLLYIRGFEHILRPGLRSTWSAHHQVCLWPGYGWIAGSEWLLPCMEVACCVFHRIETCELWPAEAVKAGCRPTRWLVHVPQVTCSSCVWGRAGLASSGWSFTSSSNMCNCVTESTQASKQACKRVKNEIRVGNFRPYSWGVHFVAPLSHYSYPLKMSRPLQLIHHPYPHVCAHLSQ